MRVVTMLGIFLAVLAVVFALVGQGGNIPFVLLGAGVIVIGVGSIYNS